MSKLKLKGAYAFDREWHKDHSALVVQKAVVEHMVYGRDLTSFIINHREPHDFMLRGKVNRDSSLHLVYPDDHEEKLANTIRYYVAQKGGKLVKRTAPKGTPGTWKRRTKITDEYYEQVRAEIYGTFGKNGVLDSEGYPHDERIHAKNKNKWGDIVESNICSGQLVADCSNASRLDWKNINYIWYIFQAHKLLIK